MSQDTIQRINNFRAGMIMRAQQDFDRLVGEEPSSVQRERAKGRKAKGKKAKGGNLARDFEKLIGKSAFSRLPAEQRFIPIGGGGGGSANLPFTMNDLFYEVYPINYKQDDSGKFVATVGNSKKIIPRALQVADYFKNENPFQDLEGEPTPLHTFKDVPGFEKTTLAPQKSLENLFREIGPKSAISSGITEEGPVDTRSGAGLSGKSASTVAKTPFGTAQRSKDEQKLLSIFDTSSRFMGFMEKNFDKYSEKYDLSNIRNTFQNHKSMFMVPGKYGKGDYRPSFVVTAPKINTSENFIQNVRENMTEEQRQALDALNLEDKIYVSGEPRPSRGDEMLFSRTLFGEAADKPQGFSQRVLQGTADSFANLTERLFEKMQQPTEAPTEASAEEDVKGKGPAAEEDTA